jgi:hypothetical protein
MHSAGGVGRNTHSPCHTKPIAARLDAPPHASTRTIRTPERRRDGGVPPARTRRTHACECTHARARTPHTSMLRNLSRCFIRSMTLQIFSREPLSMITLMSGLARLGCPSRAVPCRAVPCRCRARAVGKQGRHPGNAQAACRGTAQSHGRGESFTARTMPRRLTDGNNHPMPTNKPINRAPPECSQRLSGRQG